MSDLLQGVRVLDFTSVLMGPYATQLLADYGAEVVTLERPGPNALRVMGPGSNGLSGVALNVLRNKKSVVLDVSSGRETFLQLVRTCNVIVTNRRPESLKRLRLTYNDVLPVRPDIVWCEAHGFPTDSSRANDSAYDDTVQAESGIVDCMTRATGTPTFIPTVIADKVAAIYMAQAICAGLVRQSREGLPTHIELSMFEALRAFVLVEHGAGAITMDTEHAPGYERVLSQSRRPFRTADGWICVLPYTPADWKAVFQLAGRPELIDDRLVDQAAAIARAPSLYDDLGSILGANVTGYWLTVLRAAGLAVAEIVSLDDLVKALPTCTHPRAGKYKFIPPPVRIDGRAETGPRSEAPSQGEHTAEVLGALDRSE